MNRIKKFIHQALCLLFGLLAFEFFFAPIDPGVMSFTAGWTLAAVCCWLARICWQAGA